ncbi:MAG: sensor histidine kinase [Myxococcota bacterium]
MSIKYKFIFFLILITTIFIVLNLFVYLYISFKLFNSGKIDTYMISASIVSQLVIEKGDKECYQVIGDRRLIEYMPVAVARIYKDNSFDYLCGIVNDTGIIKYAISVIKGQYTFFTYGTDYIAILKNTDTSLQYRHLIIFGYEKDIKNYERLRNAIIIFDVILFTIFVMVIFILVRRLYFRPLENLKDKLTSSQIEDDLLITDSIRDETAIILSSVASLIRRFKNEKVELIRINEELKKAQNDLILSERLSTVGKIAASIAHEVGTPLGTVRGYIEIIGKEIKGGRTESISEYLKRMDNEIVRISNILKELLDYARPPKFNMKEEELNPVISEVINFLSVQKSFNKIQIKFNEPKRVVANFDKDRIKQILINLLMNAKDAMNGEGVVEINLSEDDNFTIVGVRDNGCGIPDSDKEKIFEPFFSTKPSGQGSGLGLAIVKRLIESMNGKIEFESVYGKGSTFKIYLRK